MPTAMIEIPHQSAASPLFFCEATHMGNETSNNTMAKHNAVREKPNAVVSVPANGYVSPQPAWLRAKCAA